MILYFSATGNCKYVAARLAEADGQEVLSIADCMREKRFAFEDETIGVISPTYDWGLPSIVKEFLEQAVFQTSYLYFVATYGTTPGATGAMAEEAIRGRGIDAYYSVRIPGRRSLTFPRRKRSQSTQSTRNRRSIAWFRACANAARTVICGRAPRRFSRS